MIYKRFLIENYKAINSITVDIDNNIIPIIGINESGKTSILQAILAFDRTKDHLINGEHLKAKNKYLTQQKDCLIVAELELENEEEVEEILKDISIRTDHPLYEWLKNKYKLRESIKIKRILGNKYELYNESISDDLSVNQSNKLLKELERHFPNILYFDDFNDRIPTKIQFPIEYKNDGKLLVRKDREWQELIVEIFSRALNNELTLQDFLNLDDDDDRENYLADVSQCLSEDIISEWKKLKQDESFFAEESIDLDIKLSFENENGFVFKIQDREAQNHIRHFNISERSKGFQWFFNFIVKLKFNPKYKSHPKNAIYLLDEPGSYLHSAAQVELLKKLCEIGKENNILYCTHSQYLLDCDVINISSIKIAMKDDGNIKLVNYCDAPNNKSMGAFSALNDALKLKFGISAFNMKKCIITEGITDYYFYKMFGKDLSDDIAIIPGQGCQNLGNMISIMLAYSDKFLVLLDNDHEGRNASQKYERTFGRSFNENKYLYNIAQHDFVLENLLSDVAIQNILAATNCVDIKSAIPILYFSKDIDVMSLIDEQTQANISKVVGVINSHFNHN